jgi:hypothetical protein
LAMVHSATYDAWAPYDGVAVDTRGRLRAQPSLRRPAAERTLNYKSMAISYAAYRVLLDLFPGQASNFVKFMADLGYDPTTPRPIQRFRRGSATWPPRPSSPTATATGPTSWATATAAHPTPTGPGTRRRTAGTS